MMYAPISIHRRRQKIESAKVRSQPVVEFHVASIRKAHAGDNSIGLEMVVIGYNLHILG
jgi:hypothetical protein